MIRGAHDIRTPLSMILGYAQWIASDNTASDQVRQEAEVIQRQMVSSMAAASFWA